MRPADKIESIAREHLGIPTLEVRRSDSLDFHEVAVWSVADALHAAFQAGQSFAIQEIDVHKLLEQDREIAIIWSIEDVQSVRPDLDAEESWKVLRRCQDIHDCNYGITWDLIDMVASDLFPEPHEGERP